LTPLSKLQFLKNLTLKSNYITDVSPLKDLKLLSALRLEDNPIEDTSALEKMEFYDLFTD
jgi:Leucine-rich repeat (LRR) protein